MKNLFKNLQYKFLLIKDKIIPYKFNEDQKRWIETLKVEKYKQTTGCLAKSFDLAKDTDEYGYCCLGVACEIFGVSSVIKNAQFYKRKFFESEDVFMPASLVEKLNLNNDTGEFILENIITENDRLANSLAGLNDNLNWSHKQIGEFIEENPRLVFKF